MDKDSNWLPNERRADPDRSRSRANVSRDSSNNKRKNIETPDTSTDRDSSINRKRTHDTSSERPAGNDFELEVERQDQPNTALPRRKDKPRPEKRQKRLDDAVSPHAQKKDRGQGPSRTLRHSYWSEAERCAMMTVVLRQKDIMRTRQSKKTKAAKDAVFREIMGKGSFPATNYKL